MRGNQNRPGGCLRPYEFWRRPGRPALSRSILVVLGVLAASAAISRADGEIKLQHGWMVQSSSKVNAGGEKISRLGFDTSGWYKTSVPNTVFAVLVENGVYREPYFGMNLRSVPGVDYKIGSQFAKQEMPENSPYAAPWWYRCDFAVPGTYGGKKLWLTFRGINYRANIWINGQKLAGSDTVAGAFRQYQFDVSHFSRPGRRNVVAVEVWASRPDELGITFVDWNPMPPDKDMGLWQEVILSASGPVALGHAFVETALDLPAAETAHLTVRAELQNVSARGVNGWLRGRILGEAASIEFSQSVTLAAGQKNSLTITPQSFPALNVKNPRLWWPYQMGEPYLHKLSLEFIDGQGKVSDAQAILFGIMQADSEKTPEGNLLFRINGRPLLVRGAGWTPDMMLRVDEGRRDAEFRYVKEMGLNVVRLEGKLENEEFFERADRQGILIMAGWCCCDAWEKWGNWNAENAMVSVASLRDQLLRLRRHPSVLAWLNGSDNPPPADREHAYLDVEKEVNWPKPVISSATAKRAELTGPSGVKMTGPYEYVSPNYWLLGTKFGGAFGFNTETSPGPAVPPLEELKHMFPPDKLWPINEVWDFHAGSGRFTNIDIFSRALEGRYGAAKDVADFVWKSQAMAYEGERAMFEAYGRNKYKSTGVIQWMLNNAWPGLLWHLYDYELRPAGGYFGTKKALELVHVQFSYDDRSITIVNGQQEPQKSLRVMAKLYDTAMRERFSREAALDVAADGIATAFAVPEIQDISTTQFLHLQLFSASGQVVSRNFYWLSSKPDVPDFSKGEWYYTPLSSYADFTELQNLPKVKVSSTVKLADAGEDSCARILLDNSTDRLAFLLRLRLLKAPDGPEILPIFWDDNYIALLPGEKREITARVRKGDLGEAKPTLAIDGFNVTPVLIPTG